MNDEKNVCLLTTIDNPFSPFTNWIKWLTYDKDAGYNTCEYLARICPISVSLTDEENYVNIDAAVDDIILNDFRNIYRKVRESDYDSNGIIKKEVKEKFNLYTNGNSTDATD